MAVALEAFVKQLADSGIIAPGKLEAFIPPKASPKDAEELARQLVQSKHLTKYQCQQIYQGRARALILGNYTILDRIGAGGMGQVFKAHHRRMERVVALKMLPSAAMKDAAAAARFHREVVAAAKLSHPNIVAAHDADEAHGVHFLIMEYVEGDDLSALVKKDGPLPVGKAVNYILQTARGLEFAHGEGVVHRDIKPANLLLDKKGVVKILDMGLARFSRDGDAATQGELTGTGAIMGTVDYMAPEQAISTRHADARADIYSLGCSLYYLLAGKPAYDGETLMGKMLAHREETIPVLRDVSTDTPEQLQAVFEKMVAKTVQDRYQTMTEVVADLERCQAGLTSASVSMARDPTSSVAWESSFTLGLRSRRSQAIPAGGTYIRAKKKSVAKRNRPIRVVLVAAGLLGVVIVAGLVASHRANRGELVVEVNQPDAVVQVLNEAGKVEISQAGGDGRITIRVNPGKHKIKVEKEGFVAFGQDFELRSGGKVSIAATLEPAQKPAATDNVHLDFDGKSCFVITPIHFSGKHPLTVEAVVHARHLGATNTVISSESGSSAGFSLEGHHSKWEMRIDEGSSNSIIAHETISADKAVHLAGVFDGSQVQLFVDGVSQGVKPAQIKFSLYPIMIGGNPAKAGLAATALFDGRIEEARISNVVRYTDNFRPARRFTPDANTLALYHFDERSGDVLKDSSDFHNDAKIIKAKWVNADPSGGSQPAPLAPAARGKPSASMSDPAFRKWIKDVAAMPAKTQAEAVGKKLMELNPGFDGNIAPKIMNGAVTSLKLYTDDVKDLSPVRALAGLTMLYCSGSGKGKGILSDLAPLEAMPLTSLTCGSTQVTDLSPLRGMRLTNLTCNSTKISDLSPLGEMPLANLSCAGTNVSDLSSLEKCKSLTKLNVKNTKVTAAGVAALQKALPDCKIEWDDPAAPQTPPSANSSNE